VLADAAFDQYDSSLTGTASGQFSNGGTGFAIVGVFVATSTTATVTLPSNANSVVIGDAVAMIPLGENEGTTVNFHVEPGSPAIDAGNPATPYNLEPAPNGGRVNLGYDGTRRRRKPAGNANIAGAQPRAVR